MKQNPSLARCHAHTVTRQSTMIACFFGGRTTAVRNGQTLQSFEAPNSTSRRRDCTHRRCMPLQDLFDIIPRLATSGSCGHGKTMSPPTDPAGIRIGAPQGCACCVQQPPLPFRLLPAVTAPLTRTNAHGYRSSGPTAAADAGDRSSAAPATHVHLRGCSSATNTNAAEPVWPVAGAALGTSIACAG